MDRTTKK